MIRIILAEDHNIVRDGLRSLLQNDPALIIAGEAANGQEVLQLIEKGVAADIILTDINMPGISGMELIENLKLLSPDIRIIMLTMLDHEKYVIKAFRLGAEGYLLKNVGPDELIFAIKHVHGNNRYICSELSLHILDKLANSPLNEPTDTPDDIELSKREAEILALIGEGYTNQEIAERLFTSKRTVEGHRQNLIVKTGVKNTAALIRYAYRNRILK